jgi:hypothetical protein
LRGCDTKPGGKTLAGGLALVTPLGTIYTTNITPGREADIGYYTFTVFARAMRLGARRDGARLYPAMPYTAYAKTSDEGPQDPARMLHKTAWRRRSKERYRKSFRTLVAFWQAPARAAE